MNKRSKLWAALGTLAVVLIITIPLTGCGAGKLHGGVYAQVDIVQP